MDSSDKKKDSNTSILENTRVDLGEDLLESTKVLSVPEKSKAPASLEDEIQQGEILMGERLFDDAKKVFRKILRTHPNNRTVKAHLEEIQKLEIQDLLGVETHRNRFSARNALANESPVDALSRLEKELQISFDKSDLKVVPDLFKTQAAYDKYRAETLAKTKALPSRERIDIVIGHLEMGLFEVAIAIFEELARLEELKVTATYLLGVAFIQSGKAIEATLRLEPFARDITLTEGQKTDFLYLMAVAFERLNDAQKAREFYRRVHVLNPRYRDVAEKLK